MEERSGERERVRKGNGLLFVILDIADPITSEESLNTSSDCDGQPEEEARGSSLQSRSLCFLCSLLSCISCLSLHCVHHLPVTEQDRGWEEPTILPPFCLLCHVSYLSLCFLLTVRLFYHSFFILFPSYLLLCLSFSDRTRSWLAGAD